MKTPHYSPLLPLSAARSLHAPRVPLAVAITAAFAATAISTAHADDNRDTVELEPIQVTATKRDLADNRQAGAGFRSDTAQVGPLGTRDLLSLPYSVTTIDSTVIENTGASSLADALKYASSAQIEARGGLDVGRPQSRGMEGSVMGNSHLDGFNVISTTALPMELYDRLEVINSLTGALYGPANPAGDFEFYSKRATAEPLRRVTLGYGNGDVGKVHADLGGPLDKHGIIGYRLNVLHEEGDGYVRYSHLKRDLASLGIDVHFSDNAVLELNDSHYHFQKTGYAGGFSYGSTVDLPSAPNLSKAGYGIAGAGLDLTTDTATALFKYRLNEDWQLVAGMARQEAKRGLVSPSNTLSGDAGDYTTSVRASVAGEFDVTSYQARINGVFDTGPLSHHLTAGATGYNWDIYSSIGSSTTVTYTGGNIYAPLVFDAVSLSTGGPRYHSSRTAQRTWLAGDTIDWGEHWSLMAVASYASLETFSYTTAGVRTATYDKSGVSPTASLIYKVRPNISTYVAYADSLQQGNTAPDTADNADETLPPYRSKQWEAGFKWRVAGINATAALFRIERPFAYTGADDNVYRVQGNQVNKGLELSAAGSLGEHWGVFSGLTLLDPKLTDTSLASTSDKQVVGVPKVQGNAMIEYRLDAVPGLVLNGNIHGESRRAGNDTNTTWAAGYTTFDLGARYSIELGGRQTVWRLSFKNIADKQYWASIFPGSVNGTNSSASAFAGEPRQIYASVTFDL